MGVGGDVRWPGQADFLPVWDVGQEEGHLPGPTQLWAWLAWMVWVIEVGC
jgi:hypothetical protein